MNDAQARVAALNPMQSFIVQAPAGSGKTELLIQRYLTLLSTRVKNPEEILAITFTKKAAAEMKERVIAALQLGQEAAPMEPHRYKTWTLARAVLERDREHEWHLLQNPNRLRIQTIDSLCAWLGIHFSNVSGLPATAEILDDPHELYLEAAYMLLEDLEKNEEWSESIAILLQHLDNQVTKVASLLAAMLGHRDQWLGYVVQHRAHKDLKEALETTLRSISISALHNLRESSECLDHSEWLDLWCFAHPQKNVAHLPEFQLDNKQEWIEIANWLLTQENQFRRVVDVRQGFPVSSSGKTKEEKEFFKSMKERFLTFTQTLNDDFRKNLAAVRESPPLTYPDSQWTVLNALLTVLPLAAAQLSVLFGERSCMDYIEQSQTALRALREIDEECSLPTELALSLDYDIQHILVDEFQDTALSQVQLLQFLTSGWQPEDQRTLFLVGDPMQSIYRFRKAEVGLFLEAQKNGLDQIPLTPLFLSNNFRSETGIVEWINQSFQNIFPKEDNTNTGAVSFKPSTAIKQNSIKNSVNIHALVNADSRAEAQKIIEIIRAKNPEASIAILVKARSHLVEIISALQDNNIAFNAVEINALAKQPIIQDLLALTRALFDTADRIAWLSVLRAPWCGLSLADLTLLTENKEATIWENCQHTENISTHGQQALLRIRPILQYALQHRFRVPLTVWIKQTWLRLGGPACVKNKTALEFADHFFNVLGTVKETKTTATLEKKIEKLFANASNTKKTNLHIMTMHKAKGLEFDVVILPELDRSPPVPDQRLVQWMEFAHLDDTRVLFAPIRPSHLDADPIYNYLSAQEKIKQEHENARLLYVAATRARQQLHLLGKVQLDADNNPYKPRASSFLALLWPQVLITNESMPGIIIPAEKQTRIHRLSSNWISPIITTPTLETQNANFVITQTSTTPQHIGVIIHCLLQLIAERGLSWWNSAQKTKAIESQCFYLQTKKIDVPLVIERVLAAIENTLSDSRGQWILKSRENHDCEWAITTVFDEQIKSFIIDRAFVEDDIFWIIDYKTFDADVMDLETLKNTYQEQLENYAQAVRHLTPHSIKLGLYCPQNGGWVEWLFAMKVKKS